MLLCTAATNPFVNSSTSHFARLSQAHTSTQRQVKAIEAPSNDMIMEASTSQLGLVSQPRERRPQVDFVDCVRQRQERLERMRRQNFAQRLVLKGQESPKASEYAMKRLPPPLRPNLRPNAGHRAMAAIKIQRAFRDYLHRRRSQGALVTISSAFITLRRSIVPRNSQSGLKPLPPLNCNQPLSIREYESRMLDLSRELETVMASIHPSLLSSAQRILGETRKELERLKKVKASAVTEKLLAPRRKTRLSSRVAVSVYPTRTSRPQNLARKPLLVTITEE